MGNWSYAKHLLAWVDPINNRPLNHHTNTEVSAPKCCCCRGWTELCQNKALGKSRWEWPSWMTMGWDSLMTIECPMAVATCKVAKILDKETIQPYLTLLEKAEKSAALWIIVIQHTFWWQRGYSRPDTQYQISNIYRCLNCTYLTNEVTTFCSRTIREQYEKIFISGVIKFIIAGHAWVA